MFVGCLIQAFRAKLKRVHGAQAAVTAEPLRSAPNPAKQNQIYVLDKVSQELMQHISQASHIPLPAPIFPCKQIVAPHPATMKAVAHSTMAALLYEGNHWNVSTFVGSSYNQWLCDT